MMQPKPKQAQDADEEATEVEEQLKSTRMSVTPLLLRLCWHGSPLVKINGWGYYHFDGPIIIRLFIVEFPLFRQKDDGAQSEIGRREASVHARQRPMPRVEI